MTLSAMTPPGQPDRPATHGRTWGKQARPYEAARDWTLRPATWPHRVFTGFCRVPPTVAQPPGRSRNHVHRLTDARAAWRGHTPQRPATAGILSGGAPCPCRGTSAGGPVAAPRGGGGWGAPTRPRGGGP